MIDENEENCGDKIEIKTIFRANDKIVNSLETVTYIYKCITFIILFVQFQK